MSQSDAYFMRLALRLARKGEGRVSPNPMVGAVVVRKGKIVATGYHRAAGRDHAEVEALRKLGFSAKGCELFVNLEPCCHYGRTPPCTEPIVRSGVKRVVVATLDSNPVVSGRGVQRLRESGIEVEVGVLEAEARQLNEPFFRWVTTGMPYVTLKMASTLDGRIAQRDGLSRWVTAEPARRVVHRMRAVSDAVLVGANTARLDDPLLLPTLVRRPPRIPLRIVVDEKAELSAGSRLAQTARQAPVLLACTEKAPREKVAALQAAGIEVLVLPEEPDGRVHLKSLLAELGRRSIQNIMVEGGAEIATSLLKQSLVDRLVVFYAPRLLGDPKALPLVQDLGLSTLESAMRFRVRSLRRVGDDIMLECVRV